MTPLQKMIIDDIKANGPMRLDRYMALCLSHPEHGYYMSRDPLGRAGDFTTAPEISQMFGEMIGVWLADTWHKMGSPSKVILLECGAGRGTLMADALRATKNVEGFHAAIDLHLLEISPVLRQAQEKALDAYGAIWHNDIETLPTHSPVLIICNEFLDALPVRQMVLSEAGWTEKYINFNKNDTFRFDYMSADDDIVKLIPKGLTSYKLGDHVEVSLEQRRAVSQMANIVQKQCGSVLFIDYGFNQNIAGDTLQAIMNHNYCAVTESPGEADLTTHVNFASLSQQLSHEKMTVHGPVSQGEFLNRLGIELRAEKLTQYALGSKNQKQVEDIQLALKRLTGQNTKAGEMGSLFKAIAFSDDPEIDLAGF
jgi:NADH dehydrogenase [ubiquinone] 1 alpha subcomplex assembly factor 7